MTDGAVAYTLTVRDNGPHDLEVAVYDPAGDTITRVADNNGTRTMQNMLAVAMLDLHEYRENTRTNP